MVITPGPGVLACVSRSLTSGPKMSAFVILGIIIGDLIFLFMAIYGLVAVAELLGSFFMIVKYCGAIYLIWLGYRTWTSKIETQTSKFKQTASPGSSFLSGISITLGNPKAIVFYLSFLPVFIDLEVLNYADVLATAIIVILTLATVLLTYSLAANKARILIQSKRGRRNLNRCSGVAMISAGVALAVKD